MTVGHSEHTPRKQEKFDAIVRMWLSIAARVQPARLRIIDCTAGSGWVEEAWGSPVRILQQARVVGVHDFQLVCIERDPEAFATLARDMRERHWQLYTDREPELHNADCRDVLPFLPIGFDPQLVYYDPNGTDWPIADLARFCSRGRADLLVHVSATAAKRNGTERLDSALAGIPKRHKAIWVDAGPGRSRAWQWSFVIATNWPDLLVKFKGKEDFHDITTTAGRALLELVSTTADERPGQYQLRPC